MNAMNKATEEIYENELQRDDFSDKEYAKIVLSFLPKKRKKKIKKWVRAGGLKGGEYIRYDGETLEVECITYDDSDYMYVHFANGSSVRMEEDEEVELLPLPKE
jgi:hypothetical protein